MRKQHDRTHLGIAFGRAQGGSQFRDRRLIERVVNVGTRESDQRDVVANLHDQRLVGSRSTRVAARSLP